MYTLPKMYSATARRLMSGSIHQRYSKYRTVQSMTMMDQPLKKTCTYIHKTPWSMRVRKLSLGTKPVMTKVCVAGVGTQQNARETLSSANQERADIAGFFAVRRT
jgi:hypothetical protein